MFSVLQLYTVIKWVFHWCGAIWTKCLLMESL